MSISDELMAKYYLLLLGRDLPAATHPLEAKKQLAFEIVQTYTSKETAEKTLADWNARFSEKRLEAAELPTFSSDGGEAVEVVQSAYRQALGVAKSRSEASRLIKQGSVQLDGSKLTDPKIKLELKPGQVLRLDKTHAVRVS